MTDIIHDLCLQYTDLSESEIAIIQGMSAVLQPIANLEDADIFVDCPCAASPDAIVVSEAKPESVPSSYKKTVVGLLAKPENEPAVARSLRLGEATKQMKAVTQENTHVIQTVEPIKNGPRVIGVLIREKRVDEDRAETERLHFSEESYAKMAGMLARIVDNSWLTECIDEALVLVDQNGVVTFRNTLARDLYRKLGFVEDPLGHPYNNFGLATPAHSADDYGNYSSVETHVGKYYLDLQRILLGTPELAYAVVIRDITWKKEQEQQLILKSVAIQEMHHRVKNNLQTIASLLRLQTRRTDNEETRKVLGESMNRILAIATTHELLARSGVDQVKLGEVIQNIKNSTVRYFARPGFNVDIVVEGDDFEVDSDVATTVALIINELLQNSLEYAYHDRSSGLIRIILTRGDLYSKLQIVDDGCGFDVTNTKKNRLGLSIVQTLVKDKLKGSLVLESGPNGTSATFDFKNQIIEIVGVT